MRCAGRGMFDKLYLVFLNGNSHVISARCILTEIQGVEQVFECLRCCNVVRLNVFCGNLKKKFRNSQNNWWQWYRFYTKWFLAHLTYVIFSSSFLDHTTWHNAVCETKIQAQNSVDEIDLGTCNWRKQRIANIFPDRAVLTTACKNAAGEGQTFCSLPANARSRGRKSRIIFPSK